MAKTFLGAAASGSSHADATITLGVGGPIGTVVAVITGAITGGSSSAVPTDSRGNTYVNQDTFGINVTLFIGWRDCTLGTALQIGDTITIPGSGTNDVAGYAWALDAVTGFDGTPGTANGEGRNAAGSAVSFSLQNAAQTNANDYMVAAVIANSATTLTGVTAGWVAESTANVTTSANNLRMWGFSETVAATGTYPLAGTLGASVAWESVAGRYAYTPGGAFVPRADRITLQAVSRSSVR